MISSLRPDDAVEFSENLLRGGDVFMREDVDLRFREPAAVDDAGVIQFVGNDVVFGREDRGDGAGIGGEAGLEHDAGFDVLESAMRSSSCMWSSWCRRWCGRRRSPAPYFLVASMAASSSFGWVVRPR